MEKAKGQGVGFARAGGLSGYRLRRFGFFGIDFLALDLSMELFSRASACGFRYSIYNFGKEGVSNLAHFRLSFFAQPGERNETLLTRNQGLNPGNPLGMAFAI